MNGVQTSTSGTMEINPDLVRFTLDTSIGKDMMRLTGAIKDYFRSPDVTMNLSPGNSTSRVLCSLCVSCEG